MKKTTKQRPAEKPFSLHPLTPEQAIRLLARPPKEQPEKKTKKKPR